MRRITPMIAVQALLAALLAAGTLHAIPVDAGQAKRSFIVQLAPGSSARDAAAIARSYGGRASFVYDRVFQGFAFEGTDSAARRLAADRRVETLERDTIYRIADNPPAYNHLNRMDVQEAENAGYDGAGIRIAVLDTGVNKDHEVFKHGNIDRENAKSCVGGGWADQEGHGTATASNAAGSIGVAHMAKVVPVKVFPGGSLSTTASRVVCGLNYVRRHNLEKPTQRIDVVNMSIAGLGSAGMKSAIDRLRRDGVVLVAAGGNHGGAVLYPARYKGVIAVSALGSQDKMAGFSASGADMTAPGVNIESAEDTGNQMSQRSGTSRSSPMVAGAAAIVLSEDPTANVLNVLRTSGRCPNGASNIDGGFCSGRWKGDDRKAEPLVNAFCAGVFADTVAIVNPDCGF